MQDHHDIIFGECPCSSLFLNLAFLVVRIAVNLRLVKVARGQLISKVRWTVPLGHKTHKIEAVSESCSQVETAVRLLSFNCAKAPNLVVKPYEVRDDICD